MSLYTIVSRIELDEDSLEFIIDKLIKKHPNDPKFAEVAKEIEARLKQEAHDVVLE